MAKMRYAFGTEREGFRDWLKYVICMVRDHRARNDGDEVFCTRCGDVLPDRKVS